MKMIQFLVTYILQSLNFKDKHLRISATMGSINVHANLAISNYFNDSKTWTFNPTGIYDAKKETFKVNGTYTGTSG
jgi:hypothetical protein